MNGDTDGREEIGELDLDMIDFGTLEFEDAPRPRPTNTSSCSPTSRMYRPRRRSSLSKATSTWRPSRRPCSRPPATGGHCRSGRS